VTEPHWVHAGDDELLRTPLRRLRLKLSDTPLHARVERLYEELEAHGIRFRPHVWFSTDWFSPDTVPGIAVPFYLGHERLARFERRTHFSCEGHAERECLRLLRHEAGHAIDTAFGLARRPTWRAIFGKRGEPYRKTYRANPFSSDHVRHLPRWYAQSHPAEDFAETFAVWLAKGIRGAPRGTGARGKLELVAELLSEIAGQKPRRVLRERPYSLASSEETLGQHYARKRRERARELAPLHGGFLDGYTRPGQPVSKNPVAAHLRTLAPRVHAALAQEPVSRYDIDQVLHGLLHDAKHRGLRWKTRKRPRVDGIAGCISGAWNRLQRGMAALPR